MTNDGRKGRQFDLEERTATFGEEIVQFSKRVPVSSVTTPLISQLVRAGTSVGANYVEADNGTAERAREIWRDAKELHLIFAAILRKGKC